MLLWLGRMPSKALVFVQLPKKPCDVCIRSETSRHDSECRVISTLSRNSSLWLSFKGNMLSDVTACLHKRACAISCFLFSTMTGDGWHLKYCWHTVRAVLNYHVQIVYRLAAIRMTRLSQQVRAMYPISDVNYPWAQQSFHGFLRAVVISTWKWFSFYER